MTIHEGYVYVLTNPAYDTVKIGCTTNTPEKRARELDGTAVPASFDVAYSRKTHDCRALETRVHTRLAGKRRTDDREFFDVEVPNARRMIQIEAKKLDDPKFFSLRKELSSIEQQLGFRHPPNIDELLDQLDFPPRPAFDEVNDVVTAVAASLSEQGAVTVVLPTEGPGWLFGALERATMKRIVGSLHLVDSQAADEKAFWPQPFLDHIEQQSSFAVGLRPADIPWLD